MNSLKTFFIKTLSLGSHQGLTEGKRFALQVAVLDGYWSFVAFFFYVIHAYQHDQYPLVYFHATNCLSMVIGLWLIHKRHYDIARPLIHLAGLFGIFYATDIFGVDSGYEYYYFTSVMMPHLTFSLDELWKSIPLSVIACIVFVSQLILGTGLLLEPMVAPPEDKIIAIVIVLMFIVSILGVARWRLYVAQKKTNEQQNEMIHSSNLIALGEMAGGIAHEINNPLQTLSLQLAILKENASGDQEKIRSMEDTIIRMGKMIQGLKDLSRDDTGDPKETFLFSKILEDVLSISSGKIKEKEISIFISGDSLLRIWAHSVQISQVLINLLNNSIDAVKNMEDKWIRIEIAEKNSFLMISVIDSGEGITEHVASNMLKPFFTTKSPSEGTGLGLSISKSILEKNGGSLFYDPSSTHTKFVMLLPLHK